MDLRQLDYLVAVAEELNFTRAARRCHIAQSGLSHQVAQLERELGAELFHRTSRSVRLTPAGLMYLPVARRILAEADRGSAELAALRGTLQGHLTVGTIPFTTTDVDLLSLLRDFQLAYPAIEVTVTDDGSRSTVAALLAAETDVAFIGLFAAQLPAGLAHRLLSVEPLVAVVGPEHPLCGAGIVDLRTLAEGSRFLESHPDSGLRAQVDEACARAKARRRVVCELRNPADLVSLALQGLGITVVPARVAERATAGGREACLLRLADAQALQPVGLGHRDPPPARPPVRAFLRLLDARWPVG